MSTAKLLLNGNDYELPLVVGTENETGVDVQKLRSESGAITLDPGYGNTGSCRAPSRSSMARRASSDTAAIRSSRSPRTPPSSRSATC